MINGQTAFLSAPAGERIWAFMPCQWGVTEEDLPYTGTISSFNIKAFFLRTDGRVSDGQRVFVKAWLPTERWLSLRGRVSYSLPAVGFVVFFTEPTGEETGMLTLLVEYYREMAIE